MYKDFGRAVEESRRKQNMSRVQLANAIGKTRQCIWLYEAGNTQPSIEVVAKLEDALNLERGALISKFL